MNLLHNLCRKLKRDRWIGKEIEQYLGLDSTEQSGFSDGVAAPAGVPLPDCSSWLTMGVISVPTSCIDTDATAGAVQSFFGGGSRVANPLTDDGALSSPSSGGGSAGSTSTYRSNKNRPATTRASPRSIRRSAGPRSRRSAVSAWRSPSASAVISGDFKVTGSFATDPGSFAVGATHITLACDKVERKKGDKERGSRVGIMDRIFSVSWRRLPSLDSKF
jgi:hypothetical protein